MSRPNGEKVLYLEHYTFQVEARDMPKLVMRPADGEWYNYFLKQVETLWDKGLRWSLQEGTKEGLLETIHFDYTDSPVNHGWEIFDAQPTWEHLADDFVGSALKISATENYAMDKQVAPPLALTFIANQIHHIQGSARLQPGYFQFSLQAIQ